jgi:hypothetical protein
MRSFSCACSCHGVSSSDRVRKRTSKILLRALGILKNRTQITLLQPLQGKEKKRERHTNNVKLVVNQMIYNLMFCASQLSSSYRLHVGIHFL